MSQQDRVRVKKEGEKEAEVVDLEGEDEEEEAAPASKRTKTEHKTPGSEGRYGSTPLRTSFSLPDSLPSSASSLAVRSVGRSDGLDGMVASLGGKVERFVEENTERIDEWVMIQLKLQLRVLLRKHAGEVERQENKLKEEVAAALDIHEKIEESIWRKVEDLHKKVKEAEEKIGCKIGAEAARMSKIAELGLQRDESRNQLLEYYNKIEKQKEQLQQLYEKAKSPSAELEKLGAQLKSVREQLKRRQSLNSKMADHASQTPEENIDLTGLDRFEEKMFKESSDISRSIQNTSKLIQEFKRSTQKLDGDDLKRIDEETDKARALLSAHQNIYERLKNGTILEHLNLEAQEELKKRAQLARANLKNLDSKLNRFVSKQDPKDLRHAEALVRNIVSLSFKGVLTDPNCFNVENDDRDSEYDFPDLVIQAKELVDKNLPLKLPLNVSDREGQLMNSRFFVHRALERDYPDRKPVARSVLKAHLAGHLESSASSSSSTTAGASDDFVVTKKLEVNRETLFIVESWLKIGRVFFHRSILPLDAVFVDFNSRENCHEVFVQTPFQKGGSLVEWLRSQGERPLERKLAVLLRIAFILGIVHANEQAHQDIKMENILMNSESLWAMPCLCDFDCVTQDISQDFTRSTRKTTQMGVGTEFYSDPDRSSSNLNRDIWSLGVVILLTLKYNGDYSKVPMESGYRVDTIKAMEAFVHEFTGAEKSSLCSVLRRIFRQNQTTKNAVFGWNINESSSLSVYPTANEVFRALREFPVKLTCPSCTNAKPLMHIQGVECSSRLLANKHFFCNVHFNETLQKSISSKPLVCPDDHDGEASSFSDDDITFHSTNKTLDLIMKSPKVHDALKSKLRLFQIIYPRCPKCDLLVENVIQAIGVICPSCDSAPFCAVHAPSTCDCSPKDGRAMLLALNGQRRTKILGIRKDLVHHDPVIRKWLDYFCVPTLE